MKQFPSIVFYGTPQFAIPSLEILIQSGYPVTAVVTAPDKPAGRGLHLKHSAVKEYALQHNLLLLQPENLSDPGFIEQLIKIEPDLQIVIAFRILPKEVWSLPKLGTFNLHASILPQYRGAAPINRAIMNGEKETGVTTFFLADKVDTGKIILTEKTHIGQEETFGELHDRLMIIGAGLVLKTVGSIERNETLPVSQENLLSPGVVLRKAPKIKGEDCLIDWNKPTTKIYNQIRGLSPYPGSFTGLKASDGKIHYIKILRAIPEFETPQINPGSANSDGKNYLRIASSDGFIRISTLQPEGKRTMTTVEFLRGLRVGFV